MTTGKLGITVFVFMFASLFAAAQVRYKQSKGNKVQYGFGIRMAGSIEAKRPVFRVAANVGIGYELAAVAYPTYHVQLQLYNGGIGTNYVRPRYNALSGDLAQALTLTLGGRRAYRRMIAADYALRNSPLYYFSDFCPPALQNPFGYSVSIGTNFIAGWGRGRGRWQRAGFFNLHAGAFQLGYSNDGTPFTDYWLGDGKDRYYTGDGFVAVHLSRKWEINTYMVSYHKFTGYYYKAFEVANSLYLANVDYGDTVQQYFNRSVYHFSVSSIDRGVSVSFDLRNRYFKDVQHLIHLNDYWVLHQVPYRYVQGISASYFRTTSFTIPKK